MPLGDPSDYVEQTIHPILRRENFDMELAIAGEVYEAFLPALALVTKWITMKEFLGWWIHLLYGIEITLPSGKSFLAKSGEEDNQFQAYRDLAECWKILYQRVTFHWIQSEGGTLMGTFDRNGYHVVHNLNYTAYPNYLGALVPYKGKIGLSTWCLYHLMSPEVRRT
jgi:hypothetical protein